MQGTALGGEGVVTPLTWVLRLGVWKAEINVLEALRGDAREELAEGREGF